MKIAGRAIGPDQPPYVIAEMSANHNGNIETAFRIIEEAKKANADAVKMQTYTADTMTLDSDAEDFQIHGGLWDGHTLYNLYEWAHTPWDWHRPLFDHARKVGIDIFSSPFDKTAIDFLEDLGAPAYKIASFEATDLPLIRYAASTGKPMIISTGMSNAEEIEEAIQTARDGGCKEMVVLHCVSGYPSPPGDYNLRTIEDMGRRFGVQVGLSDHTLDNTVAVTSVAFGATVIEKHFTLDRNGGGPDDSFSLEPAQFAQLTESVKTAWSACGRVNYQLKPSEEANVKFRRSLYFVRDLAEGEVIGPDAFRAVRPGFGAPPKFGDVIVGRRVKAAVKAKTPVRLDNIEL
jgi:N-acetylneuraminate synthase